MSGSRGGGQQTKSTEAARTRVGVLVGRRRTAKKKTTDVTDVWVSVQVGKQPAPGTEHPQQHATPEPQHGSHIGLNLKVHPPVQANAWVNSLISEPHGSKITLVFYLALAPPPDPPLYKVGGCSENLLSGSIPASTLYWGVRGQTLVSKTRVIFAPS